MKLPGFISIGTSAAHTYAVCDIGSASIAVAIVEIRKGEAGVHVLASERRSLKLEDRAGTQSVDQLKTLTQETASAVLESYTKKGGTPPREVIGVVHAPWVHSETVHKNKHFEGTVEVSAGHIQELAKETMTEKTTLDSKNIFERGVMRVALNGYPTKKPEGKKTARIDIWVLQSDIDENLARAVKEALGAVFVGRDVNLYSVAFVLNVVIQKYLPTIVNYTLVDITSVATSAFAVRGGAVVSHTDVPLGWRAVLTELASIQNTTPAEALSRVRMVGEEACTDAVCQSVSDSLGKVQPKFVDSYGKLFTELVKDKKVPGFIILVAPPDLSSWFTSILSRIDFAQFNINEQPFTVHQLYGENLMKNTELASALPEDSGIAAAAGFMHIREDDKMPK